MTAAPSGAPGRHIVVVDNDPDALELAVTDLRLEGHDVVATALHGDDALALVDLHAPDVLVVDHRMPPGPWGMDVAERVRRDHPATAVVLYTNYQSPQLAIRARRHGVMLVPKGNLRTLRRAVRGNDYDA